MNKWIKVKTRKFWRKHQNAFPVAAFCVTTLILGFSQWSDVRTLHTSWMGNHWKNVDLGPIRAPANMETCTANTYQLDVLSKENLELVQSFAKQHSIVGHWLHLDLQKLSFPEASLLSKLPIEQYQDKAEVLRNCKSVACLYDTLAGDATGETGQLAWNWYLKTGVALDWKGKEQAFSKDELKNLWALSHHLTPDFLHQYPLVSLEKSSLPEGLCAQYTDGKIRLSEKCGATQYPSTDFQFHVTTAMSEGLLPLWLTKYPEWQQRLTKSSAGSWTKGKWVQAKTLPEAWAPVVAQFVLKNEAPEEVRPFFAEQLFKRDWSLSGDMHREFKRDQWVWRDLKARHLKTCVQNNKAALVLRPISRGIASLSEPHPLAQCMRQTAAHEFMTQKRTWLSLGHPRSCEWQTRLPQGEVPLDKYLSHWETLVSKDIDQLEWMVRSNGPQWLADYQKKQLVLGQLDPTWVYFECHNGDNPKGCYQQNFQSLLSQDGRVPASLKEEMLEDYPFEALDEKVRDDVGAKRQWHLHQLNKLAQNAWAKCWQQGPNEMVKLLKPLDWVSPGVEFIDGRFATCLEKKSWDIMQQLVQGETPEARYWRGELTLPLKKQWRDEIAKAAELERSWLWQSVAQIKHSLTQDLQRLMVSSESFDPEQSCLTRLTYHYPSQMYFHDRQQLNVHLGARLCKEVLSSESLQKSLSEHKARRWKVLGEALKTTVTSQWQNRVRQHCLGRVPAAQAKALLETDAVLSCMREQFELSWPMASAQVAKRHDVNAESLEQFKNDVEKVAAVALKQQLQK
jgi:hypothetical protein